MFWMTVQDSAGGESIEKEEESREGVAKRVQGRALPVAVGCTDKSDCL